MAKRRRLLAMNMAAGSARRCRDGALMIAINRDATSGTVLQWSPGSALLPAEYTKAFFRKKKKDFFSFFKLLGLCKRFYILGKWLMIYYFVIII